MIADITIFRHDRVEILGGGESDNLQNRKDIQPTARINIGRVKMNEEEIRNKVVKKTVQGNIKCFDHL